MPRQTKKTRDAVEKLAATNPKVEAAKVRDALEILEELDQKGVTGATYGIVSPYERKPVRKFESGEPNLK